MEFAEYQEQASTTALYPGQGGFIGLAYASLGLNGEAGETGEQVKKIWRDEAADIEAACLQAADSAKERLTSPQITHAGVIAALKQDISSAFKIQISDERREKILKELGDTLWYAAQVCTELEADLGEVAQQNLDKLAERRAANKIHGEGSDR